MTWRRAISETYQVGIADESANGSSKCAYQTIEDAHRVRLDDELVVFGAEMIGDASRVLELVERRFVEADRKRLHACGGRFGHQADDEARIDAARQERAERHVADEVRANGVGEHVAERVHRVLLGSA